MLSHLGVIAIRMRRIGPAIAAAFAVLAIISPAAAQLPEYCWDLRISEKENLLVHGSDSTWVAALSHDNGFTRMWHRNMPALELRNSSDPGMPDITRFEMTIGDTRFHFTDEHFGTLAPLGMSTPDFTLTPTVADGGDKLIIDISKPGGGGLAPGELVRFRIQLGVDDGNNIFEFPDFRTVLFDMNGIEVYGPDPNVPPGAETNAQVSVRFADGIVVGPMAFPDETVTGVQSQFFNGTFPRHSMQQPIDVFDLSQCFVIPEPGSGLLGLFALLSGLTLTARRQLRRTV